MQDKSLTQMHIEAARNSTDDFNLFHDKNRWNWISNNPFNGPIALGFQLGCFIETQVKEWRAAEAKSNERDPNDLPFSGYELTFAGVVKAGDILDINIRDGRFSQTDGVDQYANRILCKASGKAVLMGFKRESSRSLISLPDSFSSDTDWNAIPDRTFDPKTGFFLKRKFMIVGNAKNFLTSAFAEQANYIDEFADKVQFPEMYPLSLISSALLERAKINGHDLIKAPMIYASHKLSIDKRQVAQLSSNDRLNILISPEMAVGDDNMGKQVHLCIGFCNSAEPLFLAQIVLLPLSSLTTKE